jgi:hypothetical protein
VTSRTSCAARRALAGVLALASLTGLSGCKYGAALAKREWVVIFKPGATQDQHRVVLATCGNIPNVVPEAMGNGKLVSELDSNVRFRIDKATDGQLAQLVTCFQRFDFIKSYDPTDFGH